MSLASLVALLTQNSALVTLAAGWLGAKLHTLLATKKADAAHQALSDVVQKAVNAVLVGAAGVPNGANGDK